MQELLDGAYAELSRAHGRLQRRYKAVSVQLMQARVVVNNYTQASAADEHLAASTAAAAAARVDAPRPSMADAGSRVVDSIAARGTPPHATATFAVSALMDRGDISSAYMPPARCGGPGGGGWTAKSATEELRSARMGMAAAQARAAAAEKAAAAAAVAVEALRAHVEAGAGAAAVDAYTAALQERFRKCVQTMCRAASRAHALHRASSEHGRASARAAGADHAVCPRCTSECCGSQPQTPLPLPL